MKNKILNHKAKLLVLCLSASLAACGGDTTNPESQHKSVSISATSTIPTSLGVSGGGHALKVDNHTGKNLTLSSFYLSGAKENHDLRINLAGCKTLANDSSCVPIFSPDEADGSTVLKLDFVDDNGEHYSAAQLVEYSSQVVESNGFYVSSANLDSMTATAAYSVAIPFVADDDYSSISIDSSIKTLSQSVDCAKGTSKGSHCTALLTLPAADQNSGSYPNTITIKGVKADGSVNTASIASHVNYSDVAHLALSNGPLLIQANSLTSEHPSLSKRIMIVNNGDQTATNIAASSLVGASWLEGVTTPSGGASLLTKAINCNGTTQATLPAQLEKGEFCEVTFTLTTPAAMGSEDYRVSYTDGINGADRIFAITKIYFRGKYEETKVTISPDSPEEIMLGESFNFTATLLSGTGSSEVSAEFIGAPYGIIVSEPSPCSLSFIENKESCHFSVVLNSSLRYDATLVKILPLSYAATDSSYKIQVSASNNALVIDPVDFAIYTPVTDPNAVVDPRFTEGQDAEKDCMIDNLTGLMWPKNANLFATLKSWNDALSVVAKMNTTSDAIGYELCGHNDWHLPTVNELASLVNYSQASSANWLNKQGFSNVQQDSFYWSSTTRAPLHGNMAWCVYFGDGGYLGSIGKDEYYELWVWPVRRDK